MEKAVEEGSATEKQSPTQVAVEVSGHAQELERNFGLLSLCAVGIVSGNAWSALGGSIASQP